MTRYLEHHTRRHSYYYHYTTLDCIDSILKTKSLWIGRVDSFNDIAEQKEFDHPELTFVLCFSTGKSEILPMWYMYAGLTGCGGRIHFTKSGIKKLLDNARYELCEKVDDKEHPLRSIMPLNSDDMHIRFQDVLYYKKLKDGSIDLAYNTMVNHSFPAAEADSLLSQLRGFTKSKIWYYEKETRLLIELAGSAAQSIEPDKKYTIVLHLDDSAYQSLYITFGPEITNVKKAMKEHKHIQDFDLATSHGRASEYQGLIRMRLGEKVISELCQYMKRMYAERSDLS